MDCRIESGNDIWNAGQPKISIGQHLFFDGLSNPKNLHHFVAETVDDIYREAAAFGAKKHIRFPGDGGTFRNRRRTNQRTKSSAGLRFNAPIARVTSCGQIQILY